MRLRWPNQITPYRSAMPGLAGGGMDISAPELPTKFYFINSLADTSTGGTDARGPNCFAGTFRYCWGADQGAGFHKVIFPLISGYAYTGRRVTGPARDNFDYIGHAAPDAGLFIRCTGLRAGGGANMRMWHLPSWLGDEASAAGVVNFDADYRDCIGGTASGVASKGLAYINCEARFGMDEAAEIGYYECDGVSWIRGAVYDPLHEPPDFFLPPPSHHVPGVDHGYAMLAGGTKNATPPTAWTSNVLVQQSLFAHSTDRNPLISVLTAAHINNLHYNHGRPNPGGRGAGLKMNDNQGVMAQSGKTMHLNVVGNVTVMGPEQAAIQDQAPVLAETTGTFPAGCTGHVAHNAQFGWVPVTSQDIFMRTVPYAGYLQPTLRLNAWYDGFGDNYQGMLRAFRNPLNPDPQEGLEFVELMRETVGCMPRRRYKLQGGLNRVFNQIADAIRGVPFPGFQYINRVSDLGTGNGGWDILPASTVIDPLAPTKDYHAPLPCDASRDTILTSGTFSNGASMAGYTKWRAWCIEQYLHVMGP